MSFSFRTGANGVSSSFSEISRGKSSGSFVITLLLSSEGD